MYRFWFHEGWQDAELGDVFDIGEAELLEFGYVSYKEESRIFDCGVANFVRGRNDEIGDGGVEEASMEIVSRVEEQTVLFCRRVQVRVKTAVGRVVSDGVQPFGYEGNVERLRLNGRLADDDDGAGEEVAVGIVDIVQKQVAERGLAEETCRRQVMPIDLCVVLRHWKQQQHH